MNPLASREICAHAFNALSLRLRLEKQKLVKLIRTFIIYDIKLHRFLFLRESYALAGHIK